METASLKKIPGCENSFVTPGGQIREGNSRGPPYDPSVRPPHHNFQPYPNARASNDPTTRDPPSQLKPLPQRQQNWQQQHVYVQHHHQQHHHGLQQVHPATNPPQYHSFVNAPTFIPPMATAVPNNPPQPAAQSLAAPYMTQVQSQPLPQFTSHQPTVSAPTQTSYTELLGRLDTLYGDQPGKSSAGVGPDLHVLQAARVHHGQSEQVQQQQQHDSNSVSNNSENSD